MYHESKYPRLDIPFLLSYPASPLVNAANVIMNVSKLAKESGKNFGIKSNYPPLIIYIKT